MKHFLYCPFTGLGLYNGSRGSRWLRNRIKIFKQFVVPSLEVQTNQNFTLWVSWRREDKGNKQIEELYDYLKERFDVVFTYHGVCFWDDKYPDDEAHERLITSLHHSLMELTDHVGDNKYVLMTIQPSDDCYNSNMVNEVQEVLKNYDACGYTKGYIMNYQTKELREYNPKTNPPFFTIKFTKEVFIDPFLHMKFTGPYKSHEYVPDFLNYKRIDKRGFIVGCHGENISTHFNHPYAGEEVSEDLLKDFGLAEVEPLQISYSLRKRIMRTLPHGWQRKLRYIFGEKLYSHFYRWIRN
jgi:hypothetical protein